MSKVTNSQDPRGLTYGSSVQFSPLTDRVFGRTWGTIQQISSSSLLCRRALWAVLAWIDSFWCCPSSRSSADHGVSHLPRCHEGWFWRGCCGMSHACIIQVSVWWRLPDEVPVDPQESWSCFAYSRWSCAPGRRYGEVSSDTWFSHARALNEGSRPPKQTNKQTK